MRVRLLPALAVFGMLLCCVMAVDAQDFEWKFSLSGGRGFQPYDVAVGGDSADGCSCSTRDVFVTDQGLNRVWKFSGVHPYGQSGSTVIWAHTFKYKIHGIAVDEDKELVYVTAVGKSKTYIKVFNFNGQLQMTVDAYLDQGTGIAVGPDGDVYVADGGYNMVVRLPSSFFYDTGSTPVVVFSPWVAIYGNPQPWGGIILDTSVDDAGHVHISATCNCYQVWDSSGLWCFNGAAAPNLGSNLRGVDAKMPFFVNGNWSGWVTFGTDKVRNYLWDVTSNGVNNDEVNGATDPEGCETSLYSPWGFHLQRLFVCSRGTGSIRVYGDN